MSPATLEAEVTNISRHGLWMLLDDREVFLPFEEFPWFRHASVGAILHVERPQANHLYWPDLDVDLDVDSIDHPELYPLTSRLPNKLGRRSAAVTSVRSRVRHRGRPPEGKRPG